MANLVISGDTSGAVTIAAPATAGTVTATLPAATGTLALTSQLAGNSTTTSSGSNVTLTASSNRVQYVSFTAPNLSVNLPNAITLDLGGPLYTIINGGPQGFELKTNAGYTIAYVRPGETYDLSLASKSTANGLWVDTYRGAAQLGYITQAAPNLTYTEINFNSPVANGIIYASPLSANSAIIFWNSSTTQYSAVVATWSGSSWSYGAVNAFSALYNNPGIYASVALSSTTGLVSVDETGGEIVYPFSISGTTITFGTKTADVNFAPNQLQALTATTAIGNEGGGASLRVVTYNGASAPTLGTAVAMPTAGGETSFRVLSSTSGIATGSSTSGGKVAIFTVSGTVVSYGTPVVSCNIDGTDGMCLFAGNGAFFTSGVFTDTATNASTPTYYTGFGVGTYSGTTVTPTNAPYYSSITSEPDPRYGNFVQASDTKGIWVANYSVSTTPTRATIGTGTYQFKIYPVSFSQQTGVVQSGWSYIDPRYTSWYACNLSSTRYLIISNNGQYPQLNTAAPGSSAPLVAGTSWFLTIADEMS